MFLVGIVLIVQIVLFVSLLDVCKGRGLDSFKLFLAITTPK